jgi:proteasome accessory factor A
VSQSAQRPLNELFLASISDMAIPKICGIETEYGIFVTGADVTPMMASSLLVNAYTENGLGLRAWDFANERPDMDARHGWDPQADYPEVEVLMANSVLTNGARFYVDHAHPEVSTPECLTPTDVVLYDRAAEEIVRQSLIRANERLGNAVTLLAHKNNSDGKGNSYGCHENFLVSRETPFGYLASSITTHFVTRQIFCGSGKVGVEQSRDGEPWVPFQLSQRADFFEEPIGLETTIRRPIVNTRDEPHCDPERWRRLHVIAGDANMSEFATFVKVGSTALLLAVIEDGVFPENLWIADPVTDIRRVSHDPSLHHVIRMADGSRMTALQVQKELWNIVDSWLQTSNEDPTSGDASQIMEVWKTMLDGLENDPLSVAHLIDWVSKKRLIDAMMQRHNLSSDHPKLRAIDLQYHDMRIDKCLALRSGLSQMFQKAEVLRAMSEPPLTTRAYFRGECIRRWPDQVVSANWDSVVFDSGETQLQRVPMMDPTKGTFEHVGALMRSVDTVRQLLDKLGTESVEGVIEDTGW